MNLPEIGEPFDELGSIVLVEFDIRKEDFDDGRAGISGVEEHQLGFSQMHGCQCTGVGTVKEKHTYFPERKLICINGRLLHSIKLLAKLGIIPFV